MSATEILAARREAVRNHYAAEANELRTAALQHAIEQYEGPDDDTLPVLRSWLRDLSVAAISEGES